MTHEPVNQSDHRDLIYRDSGIVNFVFHGLFGFLVDQSGGTVKVSTPICGDHIYAVRAATPPAVTPAWSSPVYMVPHDGLSVVFEEPVTPGDNMDRTNVLLIPDVNQPFPAKNFCGPSYFSFDVPYPKYCDFHRLSTPVTAFDGNDAPADAKQCKQYAIVHRFLYEVYPHALHVYVTKGGIGMDIVHKDLKAITVHFYAEPLHNDGHKPSKAFEKLPPMYEPKPDIKMLDNLQATVAHPVAEAGLSEDDEKDIGEYLKVPPSEHHVIHSTELRNCLAGAIQIG